MACSGWMQEMMRRKEVQGQKRGVTMAQPLGRVWSTEKERRGRGAEVQNTGDGAGNNAKMGDQEDGVSLRWLVELTANVAEATGRLLSRHGGRVGGSYAGGGRCAARAAYGTQAR